MDSIPGFGRKVLKRGPAPGSSVELQRAPPGLSPEVRERLRNGAVRHYHRTVTERHYFLAGDLPNCDWQDLEDRDGVLTVYRRDMFLDRPPLTLHGLLPGHVPLEGSEFLVWNTGGGTALWDPAAAVESVEVPANAGPEWAAPFTVPRIFHADDLPWHPHPQEPTWQEKALATAIPHSPVVFLVRVVRDSRGAGGPGVEGDGSRWLFVLAGNLAVDLRDPEGERSLALHPGSFIDLSPGSLLRVPDGAARHAEAVVLCVGHNLVEGV